MSDDTSEQVTTASQTHLENNALSPHDSSESAFRADSPKRGGVSWLPVQRPLLTLFLGSLLGGLIGGLGIVCLHETFADTEEAKKLIASNTRGPEQSARIEELAFQRWTKNAMISYAFCAAAIAASVGAATGLARRSSAAILTGLATGAILGALCGGVGGWLNVLLFQELVASGFSQLKIGMWAHISVFALVGLAAGVAAGAATGSAKQVARLAAFGVVASVLAGFLYAPSVSLIFTSGRIEVPIPLGTGSQVLWGILPAVVTGGLIGNELRSASVSAAATNNRG